MLFRPGALSESENRVIEQIEQLKNRLRYSIEGYPRRWYGLLRRTAFARAIRGSNSIEGYNVTVEDAIAAAEGGEPLEASAETWAAVQGYRSAMTYVLQLATDPHFEYSTDLIRSLHFMMIQHDLKKYPGRWRPGPIYIWGDEKNEVVYEGPDADVIPDLMAEFIEQLTASYDNEEPPLVTAAMAHLNLAMIHPFSDGNGRMARCLQTLVLARTGTLASPFSSIEEYLGQNTQEYYSVLTEVGQGKWQPGRDVQPWIRFCLTAHFHQATTLLRRSREIESMWNMLETTINVHDLHGRTIFALADAAVGLRVRNATYRPTAEISDQMASRDLKSLVDAGLLIPYGEKRGRYYMAADSIIEIRKKTRERKSVTDPFATNEDTEALILPGLEIAS